MEQTSQLNCNMTGGRCRPFSCFHAKSSSNGRKGGLQELADKKDLGKQQHPSLWLYQGRVLVFNFISKQQQNSRSCSC